MPAGGLEPPTRGFSSPLTPDGYNASEHSLGFEMLFNKAMIPNDVDTFEKLVAWAGANLTFNGYTLTYMERQPSSALGDSGVQPIFERTGPFKAYDDTPRIIFRFGLELVPDYASSVYGMDYQTVKTVVNSAPNVNFLNPAYQG